MFGMGTGISLSLRPPQNLLEWAEALTFIRVLAYSAHPENCKESENHPLGMFDLAINNLSITLEDDQRHCRLSLRYDGK